ncbi:Phosphatidylserine decarboxylase 1, related [Eimeria tenella]|uniref:Phosphatidylserine decarboxylase 1, related n=1 Tax=Eimeria tenella TaxID=5802 RepID=U6KS64_EIMTE|nr:Phosphatidylserine decarboxylase 1, related [Eimeria tenella]CDJ38273.1 Phosphatidylserine decarboxylase 1, related [Eimeria tenella]|eukprot:XP_013229111.1 Phosphatidylserine decarboxylase 1, related [Eimeria tenella]
MPLLWGQWPHSFVSSCCPRGGAAAAAPECRSSSSCGEPGHAAAAARLGAAAATATAAAAAAVAQAGSKRLPLDTRFLEVLPRVGLEQLPLLLLQQQGMSRTIEGVKGALSESPGASPSWLRGPNGRAATLLQPSNALLQQLFQQQTYFRVEFKDAEKGSLKHFPNNLFSAPRKDSSYFCEAKIPFRVSALGKQQLQQALLSGGPGGAPPEALMLAARASKDSLTEQDPTLVLVQWFRGPNGEALMRETTVHVEPEEAPVAPEGTPGRYGRRYIGNFFADNSRLFSRFIGVVARTRLNRCFLWKFWASTNIDLEEAFSLLQLRPGGPQLFPTVDLFFSRPINYDVLRPIDSEAILVSPADSALQNAFYIKPDEDGNIIGARIPQASRFRIC